MEVPNNEVSAPIIIPSHISPPSHQLCGHVFGQGKTKLGLLKDYQSKRLLKPLLDIRGKREKEFYQQLWRSGDVKLQSFVPKFFGIVTLDSVPFIELEDATEGLINPCNMDVKIGIITYDPGADCEKIKQENAKNPWSSVLGFRISGIRIHDPITKKYVHIDKHKTRKLDPEKISGALDLFLGCQFNTKARREQLLEFYMAKLHSLRDWFLKDNVNHLKFLSSSLLFVHSTHQPCIRARLKMIDFAHVFTNRPANPDQKLVDENYLIGLERLIQYFTNLQNSLKQSIC